MVVMHHINVKDTIDVQHNVREGGAEYWTVAATDKNGATVDLFLDYGALVVLQSKCNIAVLTHLGDVF